MQKHRVESFSDSVIAIIMTIMVLDLNLPQGVAIRDLFPLGPVFLCYALSFLHLAIYWNNHHFLFQGVREVNSITVWANVHFLFWLSVIPFVTAWAGENNFATVPTALYGCVLFLTGFAYWLLMKILLALHENRSFMEVALERDNKTFVSILLFAVAIPLTYWCPFASFLIYMLNVFIWIVPDVLVERRLQA